MEKEKELRNRIKEFLNRHNNSNEKNGWGVEFDERGLNQKIQEIEKDLMQTPKKKTEIFSLEIKNKDESKQLNSNPEKIEVQRKSSWEYVANLYSKTNSTGKLPLEENTKNRLLQRFEKKKESLSKSQEKLPNKSKLSSPNALRKYSPNLNKTPKKNQKFSKESPQKQILFPIKSLKNSENLSAYGIDIKKLNKITKLSYNEERNSPHLEKFKEISKNIRNYSEKEKEFVSHQGTKSKTLESAKKAQEEEIKKQNDVKKEEKVKKSPYKSEELFKESCQKIENMCEIQENSADFKHEVNELIGLIKKEKQVIMKDINSLNKQLNHFRGKYMEIKNKEKAPGNYQGKMIDTSVMTEEIITYEKETMTSFIQPNRFSLSQESVSPIKSSIKLGFDAEIQCDVFQPKLLEKEIQTETLGHFNYNSKSSKENEGVEIRQSIAELKSKIRYSTRGKKETEIDAEEYNIYGTNSDRVDEEKIKTIGSLLTTMNMDNKDSEKQSMIIHKLIDNYSIEKNEKESMELQLMNKEREWNDLRNRLDDKIKILESRIRMNEFVEDANF